VAGALCAALAAGLLVSGTITISGGPAAPGDVASAATVLAHAAAAARAGHAQLPGPGQLFWVEKLNTNTANHPALGEGCVTDWYARSAVAAAVRSSLVGITSGCPSGVPVPPRHPVSAPSAQPYPAPGSLPTQPGPLLTRLNAMAARGGNYWGVTVLTWVRGHFSHGYVEFDYQGHHVVQPLPHLAKGTQLAQIGRCFRQQARA
jgi:hypothetical protein